MRRKDCNQLVTKYEFRTLLLMVVAIGDGRLTMDDGRCTMMDVSSSAAIFLGNKISLVFPKSGSFLSFQLSRDPIFARSNTTGLCEGSISSKQTTTTTQHTQSRQNLERQSSSFHHYTVRTITT